MQGRLRTFTILNYLPPQEIPFRSTPLHPKTPHPMLILIETIKTCQRGNFFFEDQKSQSFLITQKGTRSTR
jgi:hypothetical protein